MGSARSGSEPASRWCRKYQRRRNVGRGQYIKSSPFIDTAARHPVSSPAGSRRSSVHGLIDRALNKVAGSRPSGRRPSRRSGGVYAGKCGAGTPRRSGTSGYEIVVSITRAQSFGAADRLCVVVYQRVVRDGPAEFRFVLCSSVSGSCGEPTHRGRAFGSNTRVIRTAAVFASGIYRQGCPPRSRKQFDRLSAEQRGSSPPPAWPPFAKSSAVQLIGADRLGLVRGSPSIQRRRRIASSSAAGWTAGHGRTVTCGGGPPAVGDARSSGS